MWARARTHTNALVSASASVCVETCVEALKDWDWKTGTERRGWLWGLVLHPGLMEMRKRIDKMVEANVNALAAASPAAGAGARALDLPFLVSLAKWSETWTLWLPLAPALMMMMSFICICTHCLKLICTHWLTLPSAHS